MSPRGRENYGTLRELYLKAEWRRFRVKHRTNRHAEMLGYTPDGKHMVGFWEGHDEVTYFAPDDLQWTELLTYV